jgi:hypothetical protein
MQNSSGVQFAWRPTQLIPRPKGENQMSIDLPKPIAAYFSADKRDADAVVLCFTEDAVVKDEGQTYSGLPAIKQWKAETSRKYTYTSDPFSLQKKAGETVVTSRLTGNFAGSPVDLRFFLTLKGDKIASLKIIP